MTVANPDDPAARHKPYADPVHSREARHYRARGIRDATTIDILTAIGLPDGVAKRALDCFGGPFEAADYALLNDIPSGSSAAYQTGSHDNLLVKIDGVGPQTAWEIAGLSPMCHHTLYDHEDYYFPVASVAKCASTGGYEITCENGNAVIVEPVKGTDKIIESVCGWAWELQVEGHDRTPCGSKDTTLRRASRTIQQMGQDTVRYQESPEKGKISG